MTGIIKITNARLSFPSLFRRSVFEGKEGKFEATFLIPKNDPVIKQIKKAIEEKISEAKIRVPSEKLCLKDGDVIFDEKGYEGYEGHYSLKASNNDRIYIVDQRNKPITEDGNIVYAGCYVNAIIDLWVQNNAYGKRINANLHGIQFVKDGDPFGLERVDASQYFDTSEDGSEEF
jgi:hypothetical protein